MSGRFSGFKSIAAIFALVLGAFVPLPTSAGAAASTTLSVTQPAGYAPYADGVWYEDLLWIKNGNRIRALDSSGNEFRSYTFPSSTGSFSGAYRVAFDPVTGRMFFGTDFAPMKLWWIDLDDLVAATMPGAIDEIQPVQIFQGLGTECRYNTGGIAFRPAVNGGSDELYFGCPHSSDVSKNKLYKISIPTTGVVTSATVVANGPFAYSFIDLEYRAQDDMLFALMRSGAEGEASYIARIRPSAATPTSPSTVIESTMVSGQGGISGIEIDSTGAIFYTTYQNSTTSPAGYQLTQEAPTGVGEGIYTYPDSGLTDYSYSHDLIAVGGSQSLSDGLLGYQTNGHGGLVKITGTAASNSVAIPYTVTFHANDGTSSTLTQEAGTSTALDSNAFVRSGYAFAGWDTIALGGGTDYADEATYAFDANLDLYAQWDLETYNLTFDSQGGTAVAATTFDVETSVASPSDPTLDGYTFTGWATSSSGTPVTFPYSPAAGDRTLYAQWSAITYNLTFDPQGGSAVDATTFDLDSQISEPAQSIRSGYTFEGWATTSSGTPVGFPFTASAGDFTFYAQWSLNSYVLTFDSQGGSAVSATAFDVANGISEPAASSRDGYTFAGWSTSSEGSALTFPYSSSAGDLTLYALWTLNTYNLTFDSQGGSNIDATTFDVENLISAPSAPAREGYDFLGWSTSAEGSAVTFPYAASAGDLTLYAQWQEIEVASPSAPVGRPLPQVTSVTDSKENGTLFGLVGSNLDNVTKVVIGGIEVVLVDVADHELSIEGLDALQPGNYDIELYGPFGRLVVQGLFRIDAVDAGPVGSTKLLEDGLLKVRVFNAASGEKIQIFHNGREIAWVRTIDEGDPRLHNGYLVRTVNLRPGKNVFEIYVDGERIRRNAYAGS